MSKFNRNKRSRDESRRQQRLSKMQKRQDKRNKPAADAAALVPAAIGADGLPIEAAVSEGMPGVPAAELVAGAPVFLAESEEAIPSDAAPELLTPTV